jgi:hypothetical protein
VSISAPVLMAGVTGDILARNPLAHTLLTGRLDVHAPRPATPVAALALPGTPSPYTTLGLPAAE